ncbi:MAG TPA: hypothetical protein VFN44_22955, partial [Solirubrobacteraceae bacterium]|nr:hypothetical protein [Solirubrobacteraceae bacterium]
MTPDQSTIPLRTYRSPHRAPAPRTFGTPRVAAGLVPRPRLLRRLDAARDIPLVLLVAPAGYGKTTLLAEWAARSERPFDWVRPRELDEPDGGQRLLERHASGGPVVIAVDDAQLASAAAIEELADAACRLPAGSTLAIASRRRLGAPVARLSAHRLALALGPAELAMTRLEASLLLDATGLRLDGPAIDGLVARTKGWPAVLAIAAQALAEQPQADGAAADFGGTDRMLAGYLRAELLAQLPAHRLAFLRRTSIVDELSPRLCDAIIGRGDAARALDAIASADVGLEPVDRTGVAFRLHPLVRDLLRADLERLEPGLAPELHRRAGDWHGRHGRPEEALRHAVATCCRIKAAIVAGDERETTGRRSLLNLGHTF